jgi:gas vesicle protein
MNRVLYLLIGGAVAAMAAFAFFQQRDIGKMSSADALAGVAFCAVLAAAACALIYTRRGRELRLRIDEKTMNEDDRTRMNARTKGEVRPPMGS